ncbi:MAG: hypothetical protein Q6K99_07790 [Thermostichales cyanobacterium BF4_bins_65]
MVTSNGYRQSDSAGISLTRWFSGIPQRSLAAAYQAALAIQELEAQHFQGNPIPPPTPGAPGQNTQDYLYSQLQKHLATIQMRLAEFRATRFLRNGTPPDPETLAQLAVIDQIQARYHRVASSPPPDPSDEDHTSPATRRAEAKSKMRKTAVVPRSLLDTINRITKQLSPNYTAIAQEEAAAGRDQTIAATKFLVLLILLPLLASLLSRQFIYSPLVDRYLISDVPQVSFNLELQERAFRELELYRERLEFEELLGIAERSPQVQRQLLEEKAVEIESAYRKISTEGLKNILADLTYMATFAWVVYLGRAEIIILKSFLDDLIYGLSDSAKAFIIILFTDIFVGYHSPHGWEVLLTLVAHHLGMVENPMFNGAFIATIPVILDTLFKYWIFRYLNRVSPSAVATYRTMNE